jgi:hypothetical protein
VDNLTASEDSPLYLIRAYISLNRFQQISRYLKINQAGKINDNLKDKDFWHKVDPLVTSFRQRCRADLRPGNTFSINEQLRRNRGRWKHALQILSRPRDGCYDWLTAQASQTVTPRSQDTGPCQKRRPLSREFRKRKWSHCRTVVMAALQQSNNVYRISYVYIATLTSTVQKTLLIFCC